MSLAMQARINAIEEEIQKLKKPYVPAETVDIGDLEARVKDLENKYRMMNARISRKE